MRVPRGPNRATAANPAGLTGRQVEVLGLLVEGLTDAEIAARLSLSAKTSAITSPPCWPSSTCVAAPGAAAARRLGVVPAKNGESDGQS